jgi:ferredoxin-NADP reductase
MARAAVLGRLSWRVAQLADTRDETATARTLILDVPGWPGHLPGQHVDVRLTAEDGYSTQRSYSIASAPAGSRLELTIQRLDDGEVSPYLAAVLSRGDPVELRGPIGGYFAWRPDDPAPVLLIGGGSGVVPLMAMVRTRIASGSQARMRLIYSTRSRDTLLYAAELDRIAADDDGLSVHIVYTRAAPPGWDGRTGRLDSRRLAGLAGPQAAAAACFVCGPTGFVESIADLLIDQGLSPRQVKTERFGPSGGT